MKKPLILVAVVLCLVVIGLVVRPIITLEVAKIRAVHKFNADSTAWLSHVPSAVTNIAAFKSSTPTAEVELSGCMLALPTPEFRQDPGHKSVFTNDSLLVGFFGAIDPTNFASLEQEVNCSNVFDLISRTYNANVGGIYSQRSMAELHGYLGLIALKSTIGLGGLDHSFLRFNRGDFKGFVGGIFPADKIVTFEIYVKEKDEFLGGLVRARNPGCNMNDVFHILSVLSVKIAPPTNAASPAN